MKTMPIERLHQLLDLDAETGRLFWKPRTAEMHAGQSNPQRIAKWFNSRNAGKEALTAICDGYRKGIIEKRTFAAHRVVFAMTHGRWPDGDIDHINGDRSDNRPSNLRDVTRQENSRNRATRGASGVMGVCWSPRHKRWMAAIDYGKRQRKTLGYYKTLEEAAAVRRAAEQEAGFHPNHGTRQA